MTRRIAQLIVGLFLYGIAIAMMLRAGLGTAPWDVLTQGIVVHTGWSFGLLTNIIGAAVLLLWIPLRERPGLGTISNAVIIAIALQVMVVVLPTPHNVVVRLAFVLFGIALIGVASGLYLTTNLGPGPRDGWMTGLHVKFGWPISAVRLAIEAVVLVLGWLLGGTVGIGTMLFALLIGPAVGYGLRLAGRVGGTDSPAIQVIDLEFPEGEA